jgi:hypothetical protein
MHLQSSAQSLVQTQSSLCGKSPLLWYFAQHILTALVFLNYNLSPLNSVGQLRSVWDAPLCALFWELASR